MLQKLVRERLQELFNRQGHGKYGPEPQPEVVVRVNDYVQAQTRGKKRLAQDFRFEVPAETTADNIAIDYVFAGPKTSGYNKLMAQIFTQDFLENVDSDLTFDAVRALFFARVKTLKADRKRDIRMEEQARSTGASKDVLEARRTEEASMEQRCRLVCRQAFFDCSYSS